MKWSEPLPVTIPSDFTDSIGGSSLVAETLIRKGIVSIRDAQAYLNPDLYSPCPPSDIPNLCLAVDRISRAIENSELICVWGDFDVDGQTATALLVEGLMFLGGRVIFYIPVRARESHGVNLLKLSNYLDHGIQLLLTCDTGITAHDAVELARSRGIDTIITDHHDLPATLPNALLVNPRMLPAGHPLTGLPGVGVAYQVIYELFRRSGYEKETSQFLDLVALGIVSDLALHSSGVRNLLQNGLKVLRETNRLGLKAIFERAELDPVGITEEHISFYIGPRLNALGRLADANQAVEILTTKDRNRANVLAVQLETLNARRKFLSTSVFQGALAMIRADPSIIEKPVIVLQHPSWPSGVIGIVASRLVERFGKPAILISVPENEPGRGSARSIEGINITAGLNAVSDYLLAFGGHPMAAGFSIDKRRISEFTRNLCRTILQSSSIPEANLEIDGYLQLSEIDLSLVADLERLAPFGPGNAPLTLVSRRLKIKSHSTLGKDEEHLLVTVIDEDTGFTQKVIWWQGAGWTLPEGIFDLAYRVRANSDRGERRIQVEWVDLRVVDEDDKVVRVKKFHPRIQDYRKEPHPMTLLQIISSQEETQIWAEGEVLKKLAVAGIQARNRLSLQPCGTLVIWTIPPGPMELGKVIEKSVPTKIILFGEGASTDRTEDFLTRLGGLVKFALRNKGGNISVEELATWTAQRETTIRKGLKWMEAQGFFGVLGIFGDEIQVIPEGRIDVENQKKLLEGVQFCLDETKAYRSYFLSARVESLFREIDDDPNEQKPGKKV